ncbi:restriction endonuclease subunit S [Candidatus Saccharibacteria bacterium]|nr:restriction endonuclease subunit S [Candidatus Saccharibacteria bacterium]
MDNTIRLKDACKILNGFAFKSSKYVDSGIRIIRIANVQKGYVEDEKPAFYPDSEEPLIRDYMLKENDLLLSLTGNVGRVALLDKKWLPAALNQRVACLRIKDDRIIKDYLYFALLSDKFENDCIKSSKGIAQKNMSTEWLKDYEIPLPSEQRQREIVSSLKHLSAIIKNKTEQIRQLDNLVKARFVEMFDGDYEEVELSELGKISTGSTPPMKNKDFYENADMPFYKPGDFIDGVSNIDCSESFVDARAESVSRIMDPGTVAVTCIGIIGKIGIIKRRGICNQQINFIAPNDNVNSIYLAYAIDTKKKFMQEKANAPVVPILNKTNFSKVTIPFAPVELQNQFAAFVAQVDKSKFALGDELAMGNFYIRLIYDRIMHGRIDLRVA